MRVLLPEEPGTYALQLHLSQPLQQEIGRLGRVQFPAGELIYVGSAFGPGGLHARLGRHLNRTGTPRWHIDYLLPSSQLVGFWATTFPSRLECHWVASLAALPGASYPACGLGSSDCRHGCPAHLLAFSGFDQQEVGEQLKKTLHEVAHREQLRECPMIRGFCQPNERFT